MVKREVEVSDWRGREERKQGQEKEGCSILGDSVEMVVSSTLGARGSVLCEDPRGGHCGQMPLKAVSLRAAALIGSEVMWPEPRCEAT